MNNDLINTTLEVTENPGLDILDPRFGDITTLVENGDYPGAAAQAQEILEEGVYDIRITGFFLYGHFLEEGVGGITTIFGCLSNLLTENWDAIGPVKNRERHAQSILSWFLRQLLKKLQHEEDKKSDVWQQWTEAVSSEDVQEALDAGETFQKALGMTLEDQAGIVMEGLAKVNDWLGAFQRIVYREPESEPEEEPGPEAESESSPKAVESTKTITAPSDPAYDETAFAEGSYHMRLLMKKMKAFERLIEKEQFSKAAVVADDINDIITHFDPRIYFPKMFSKYSLLMALNIGELTAFEEYKGSAQWQTMQDLYKVDLDSFVGLDADMTLSSLPSGGYPAEDLGDEEESYDDEPGEAEDDWEE